MLAECAACGTRFAPDLERCPHCGSEERAGEMAKITTADGPSYPEGHAPGDGEDHVRPAGAAGAPEGAAEAPEAVPEALDAPAGPVVPAAPPKAPPRRTPPPGAPGE